MNSIRKNSFTTLTVESRTQSVSGFEKHTATWATDTTVGASGVVLGLLLDAGAKQKERAQARGEVADQTIITPYPVGLVAEKHRFQTSGGTNYRVIEATETAHRGMYVTALDTS